MANRTCLRDGEPCYRSRKGSQLNLPLTSPLSHVARLALLCSLILISLALPVAVQSSSWTASNYKVFYLDPWAVVPKQNNGSNSGPPSVPTFAEIEDYYKKLGPIGVQQAGAAQGLTSITSGHLKEAGNIYESIGLPEPIFGPKDSTRGVFLFSFPGSNLPAETAADGIGSYIPGQPCNSKFFQDNWIAINANTNLTDSLLQYKSIAHELFHAIQHQSMFQKGLCSVPKWIHEGTADAAGWFLLEKKSHEASISIPATLKTDKFYGIRPYDVPLHQDESWDKPEVKRRFGQEIEAYDLKEIYSHFGYRTSSFWRYLMDNYDNTLQPWDPNRLLALSKSVLDRPYAGNELYLNWVAWGVGPTWGPFSHAYSQFLAEFAAWPGTKYPNLKIKDVLKDAFGGCEKRTLHPDKTSDTITLTPNSNTTFALHPIAGRCIQVTLKGFKKGTKLKLALEADVKPIPGNTVQATVEARDLADQLTLGWAREERGGKLKDNCYTFARGSKPKEDKCLLLGNSKKRKGKKPTNGIRTWRFKPRKVKDPTSTTTFILTNVAPLQASKTKGIKELDVRIGLLISQGHTDKGAQLDLPKPFNLGELPDMTIPRRQALYGIKKYSGVSSGYAMNLGVFQVAALDELGKKTETYALSPIEPIAFGQAGPFKAMLMVASNGGVSTGAMATIGSQFCDPESPPGNIGTITRSDYEILEISIDTPLCELSVTNIMACEGGCPVVDHFKGKLSLPFGWRYFGENEIEDLVTPGVLLDIDRYHYNVFGTPLQGLSGGGSSGGNGSGGGGSGSGNTSGGGGSQGGTIPPPPCDCSCEGYEKHREKLKEIKASKIPDFNILGQMLQCDQQCAKPFRDCRRAQKRR